MRLQRPVKALLVLTFSPARISVIVEAASFSDISFGSRRATINSVIPSAMKDLMSSLVNR